MLFFDNFRLHNTIVLFPFNSIYFTCRTLFGVLNQKIYTSKKTGLNHDFISFKKIQNLVTRFDRVVVLLTK